MPTLSEQLSTPPEMLVPTSVTAPTPPLPAPAAAVDEFAQFEDAAPVDEFAQFEDAPDEFAAFPDADDLDIRSTEDLSADRDTFNPKEYYASNPDVARDPAKLAKLLAVYRQRDKEGLSAAQVAKAAVTETLPTVGKIFGGLRDLAAGAINIGLQPAANVVGSVFTGDIFDKQRRQALFEETRKQQKQAIAESAAASELSATGIADLARQGIRKFASRDSTLGLAGTGLAKEDITGAPKPEKTDQELLRQIAADVEFSNQLQEIARGGGEAAKAIGLDADTLAKEGITLDKEVIERLSLVDPLTIIAGGGVFSGVTSAGKTVFTAASRAAAESMIQRISQLSARALTAPVRAAGATAELTGIAAKKIAPLAPTIGAGIGTVSGGLSAAGGYFTGKAVQRVLPKLGTALEVSGQGVKRLANTVADSATFQKALVGAAEGSAAAVPFVAATDDDATAGAILGAGAALGGGIRGSIGVKDAVGRRVAAQKLAPKDIPYPKTESPGYGLNENLDFAHSEGIKMLPEKSQNTINAFRETVRDLGGEVYVLDPEFFQQSLLELAERNKGDALSAAEVDAVRRQADAQGGYFDATLQGEDGQPRRAIFLNNRGNPIAHETGHLFTALLSPERQADLTATVREVYTPDQIEQFRKSYEQSFGEPITEDRAIAEIINDNFSQLFQNTPISEIATPPTLLSKIGRQVTDVAESLGLDLTASARTEMGMPSSLRFNDVIRDTAREILGTREPRPPVVEPAQPATPARPEPISLTEAAQTLSAMPETVPGEIPVVRRESTAGVERAPAPKKPAATKPAPEPVAEIPAAETARVFAAEAPEEIPVGGKSSPRELLGKIAEAIANEGGVKLNYLSAPDEPAASISSNRDIRRAVIELNREAPPEARKLWEKNFVPDKVIKTRAGKYQVQGIAPEVFASNAHKMAKFLAEVPDAGLLSPYPIDPKTKTFTVEGWQQLFNAAQTVSHNHMRGYTGAGEPLVVPRSVADAGGYAPQIKPGAKLLAQNEADFINLLLNFKLPETPRMQPGKRPMNVQAQEISAATKPGRIRKPVRPREPFSGPEAEAQNIAGREILEVNPLRGQLEQAAQAAGVAFPSLIEAIQKLNLENIKEVVATPEQPALRVNTLTASAGFQPKRLSLIEVRAMSPEQFKEATAVFTGRYGSGLSGLAFELGSQVVDAAGLSELQAGLIESQNKIISAKSAMDLDTMFAETGKAGFWKEAIEAATGEGPTEAFIQRNFDPAFQSPLKSLESLTGSAAFQPAELPGQNPAKPGQAAAFVPMPQAEVDRIADAIYIAEGGAKTKYPYGILSVKVGNDAEARQVAINTIRNNYKRWHDAGRPGDYLEFLASRYAPVGAANDKTGLNKNWLKNVRAMLKKK